MVKSPTLRLLSLSGSVSLKRSSSLIKESNLGAFWPGRGSSLDKKGSKKVMCWAAKIRNSMLTLRWMTRRSDRHQWLESPIWRWFATRCELRSEGEWRNGDGGGSRTVPRCIAQRTTGLSRPCDFEMGGVWMTQLQSGLIALSLLLLGVRKHGSLASKAVNAALSQADRQGSRSPFERGHSSSSHGEFLQKIWSLFADGGLSLRICFGAILFYSFTFFMISFKSAINFLLNDILFMIITLILYK